MLRTIRERLSPGTLAGRTSRRQFLGLVGAGALGMGASATQHRIAAEGDNEPEASKEVPLTENRRGVRKVAWSVDTDRPRLALTFDDGPDPRFTPRILDILDRYNITATFMAMGYNAETHRSLMNEVVAAGHEIGSHTWSHRHFPDLTPETTRMEISRGAAAVEDVVGKPLTLFRPPKGRMTEAALAYLGEFGYDVVMWSVTRGALDERDPAQVAHNVVDGIGPGDIVLLHDGVGRGTFYPGQPMEAELSDRREAEVRGLPQMIETILAHDLEPSTVSSLLEAPKAV